MILSKVISLKHSWWLAKPFYIGTCIDRYRSGITIAVYGTCSCRREVERVAVDIFRSTDKPGAHPTILSCNATAVKNYIFV
jgi:hypothetical protein